MISTAEKSLIIKTNQSNLSISFDDIRYIRSFGNYVKIHCKKEFILMQVTTKFLEDYLPKEYFIRVHKSFIVNKWLIEQVNPASLRLGEIEIPIGKTFIRYVREKTASLSM